MRRERARSRALKVSLGKSTWLCSQTRQSTNALSTWWGAGVEVMGLESERPGFRSQLGHSWSCDLGQFHLATLNHHFLIYKMGIEVPNDGRIKWDKQSSSQGLLIAKIDFISLTTPAPTPFSYSLQKNKSGSLMIPHITVQEAGSQRHEVICPKW